MADNSSENLQLEVRVARGDGPDAQQSQLAGHTTTDLYIEIFSNDPKRAIAAVQQYAPELAREVAYELGVQIMQQDPAMERFWQRLSPATQRKYEKQGRPLFPYGQGVARRLMHFSDGTIQRIESDGETTLLRQGFGWIQSRSDENVYYNPRGPKGARRFEIGKSRDVPLSPRAQKLLRNSFAQERTAEVAQGLGYSAMTNVMQRAMQGDALEDDGLAQLEPGANQDGGGAPGTRERALVDAEYGARGLGPKRTTEMPARPLLLDDAVLARIQQRVIAYIMARAPLFSAEPDRPVLGEDFLNGAEPRLDPNA